MTSERIWALIDLLSIWPTLQTHLGWKRWHAGNRNLSADFYLLIYLFCRRRLCFPYVMSEMRLMKAEDQVWGSPLLWSDWSQQSWAAAPCSGTLCLKLWQNEEPDKPKKKFWLARVFCSSFYFRWSSDDWKWKAYLGDGRSGRQGWRQQPSTFYP